MKLLVVEDDRETAAYLVKGLGEKGYTVDQSGDGREGLFLASSGSYDAIILDRMLPGMDGLALLREIKQRWPELPVMMVTAYGDDERRQQVGAHGAAEFMTLAAGEYCPKYLTGKGRPPKPSGAQGN